MRTTEMLSNLYEAQDYHKVDQLVIKYKLNRERVFYCLANANNFNHFCRLWAYSNKNYLGFPNQYTI